MQKIDGLLSQLCQWVGYLSLSFSLSDILIQFILIPNVVPFF